MIGDGDVDLIFENGDFDVAAVFDTEPDATTIRGWFTAASQGVRLEGNIEVEASKPSFTAPTASLADVRNKMSVTIDGTAYKVERVEQTGISVSVVWLKESNA